MISLFTVLAGILGFAIILLVIVLWWVAIRRYWKWLNYFLVFGLVAAVVAGLMLGLPAWLALITLVAVLSAWDLGGFWQRLRLVKRDETTRLLKRQHLVQLLVIDGVGMLLVGSAFLIRLQFGFWLMAGLALLVALGLIGVVKLIGSSQ